MVSMPRRKNDPVAPDWVLPLATELAGCSKTSVADIVESIMFDVKCVDEEYSKSFWERVLKERQ